MAVRWYAIHTYSGQETKVFQYLNEVIQAGDMGDKLTQVLMPTQDGWDVLRELASHPETREIPVILCSVLPERSLALSLGVAAFLNKPVTQAALLDALEQCLRTQKPSTGRG